MDRHASVSLLYDVIIFKFLDNISLASIEKECRQATFALLGIAYAVTYLSATRQR